MKKTILLLIITFEVISYASCQKTSKNPKLNISFNRNVEVLSIIYCLTEDGQMMLKSSPDFTFQNELIEEFIDYSNHPSVVTALNLNRNGNTFWWDALVTLAHHCDQFPKGKLNNKLPDFTLQRANSDLEKADSVIKNFINQINDFYNVAKLDDYFIAYSPMYDQIENEIEKNLPKEDFIKELEEFYKKTNKSYTLCPSPIIFTGFGFASYIETKKELEVINTFGRFDSLTTRIHNKEELIESYGFGNDKEIRNLTVHEFGHAFVNTITQKPKNLIEINKLEDLFNPIRKSMSNQGYSEWIYCFNEHLVRLGEIRIAQRLGDSLESKKLKNEYINELEFIYINNLLEIIEDFEQDTADYMSFEDFLPKILEYLSKIDSNSLKNE